MQTVSNWWTNKTTRRMHTSGPAERFNRGASTLSLDAVKREDESLQHNGKARVFL